MNYEGKPRGNVLINIHNIHLIHNESMALVLFITSKIKSSLMNNLLGRYLMQWDRVCKTLNEL